MNANPRGTILIADYDFGDVDISERYDGAGFQQSRLSARTRRGHRLARRDGVLAQYAPIGVAPRRPRCQ
jgi:hypothetical protein